MKKLDWLRRSSRVPFMSQPAPVMGAERSSDLVEALLYLRRASELLHANGSLDRTGSRVDRAICELQEVIAFARQG